MDVQDSMDDNDESYNTTLFVEGLDASIIDKDFWNVFSEYGRLVCVKIPVGNGCGSVQFSGRASAQVALEELNGTIIGNNPVRISWKRIPMTDDDANNTTLFVGGLDASVIDQELWDEFSHCGHLVSVKIPVGKRYGFIQFASRINAENALERMKGLRFRNKPVRLSWARSPVNKQQPRESSCNQWNGREPGAAYYGGGQGYGHAVAPMPQDLRVLTRAAYSAYLAAYGNNQQVSRNAP